MHSQDPKIVHGDLRAVRKCKFISTETAKLFLQDNVFVDSDYSVCIADFGLSRIDIIQTLMVQSMARGNIRWQAPERIKLKADEYGHVTTFSDVYAFGITCYEVS